MARIDAPPPTIGAAGNADGGLWSGGDVALGRAVNAPTGAAAIHDDWDRYVLIFCQISDFQLHNANKKSNESI
ncbi:MAG: hypothetical protein ACJ8R9_23985 [Steroidobacteraceae bacterium]